MIPFLLLSEGFAFSILRGLQCCLLAHVLFLLSCRGRWRCRNGRVLWQISDMRWNRGWRRRRLRSCRGDAYGRRWRGRALSNCRRNRAAGPSCAHHVTGKLIGLRGRGDREDCMKAKKRNRAEIRKPQQCCDDRLSTDNLCARKHRRRCPQPRQSVGHDPGYAGEREIGSIAVLRAQRRIVAIRSGNGR